MARKGLFNEDIMNMLLNSGGYHSDDLKDSEEVYIPSAEMVKLTILLSDNRTNNEDDNTNENMFELDSSISDIRKNTFTSRNKSET